MKKRMKQLAALSMAHQILQARAEKTKKSCIGTSEQNHRIKMLLIKQ